MEKEDVVLLAQLLQAMKEAVGKLERCYDKKDSEKLAEAKREILAIQQRINSLL